MSCFALKKEYVPLAKINNSLLSELKHLRYLSNMFLLYKKKRVNQKGNFSIKARKNLLN